MRILITGGKGMLGRTLQRHLAGHDLFIADLPEVDILDREGLVSCFQAFRPEVVIHCAAMTKVDACEEQSVLAFRLNGMGSANVAEACRCCGARLIAISTDYVFSGDVREWSLASDGGHGRDADSEGWRETDPSFPRTVYGKSKLAGERSILDVLPSATILRTAWLYGAGGPSFIHTMVKLGKDMGEPLRVVNDQKGNPTSTDAVADVIVFLLQHPEVKGVVHGTCEGICTWYDLTVELFRLLGVTREVIPCMSEEGFKPGGRPVDSALEKTVLLGLGYHMPRWQDALSEFVRTEFA